VQVQAALPDPDRLSPQAIWLLYLVWFTVVLTVSTTRSPVLAPVGLFVFAASWLVANLLSRTYGFRFMASLEERAPDVLRDHGVLSDPADPFALYRTVFGLLAAARDPRVAADDTLKVQSDRFEALFWAPFASVGLAVLLRFAVVGLAVVRAGR
jgi:hypothetical protein